MTQPKLQIKSLQGPLKRQNAALELDEQNVEIGKLISYPKKVIPKEIALPPSKEPILKIK